MLGELSVVPDAPAMPQADPARGVPATGDRPGGAKPQGIGRLVLTRHLGESIMIGDAVEVVVAEIRSGTVRLKVIAPRSIAVHRREVFDSIQAGLSGPAGRSPAAVAGPVAPRAGKAPGGLVLARSARQSIMIGEEVEVLVDEIRPAAVKLRIAAPKSVTVDRLEVFEARRDAGF